MLWYGSSVPTRQELHERVAGYDSRIINNIVPNVVNCTQSSVLLILQVEEKIQDEHVRGRINSKVTLEQTEKASGVGGAPSSAGWSCCGSG